MVNVPKVQELEFNKGDFIIREGANCDCLIIVKSGQIEVFKNGKNNMRIPLGIVQSGEYLGEMALISDRPHSANAMALTKTVCIKIPNGVIEDHLKGLPGWMVALTRGLVYKLNKTNDVLKRNGIVDDTISIAVRSIVENDALSKTSKTEEVAPEPVPIEASDFEKVAPMAAAAAKAAEAHATEEKKTA